MGAFQNKYGSLIETFVTYPQVNTVLSAIATPPADLVLTSLNITAPNGANIFARGGNSAIAGNPFDRFKVNDIPRCIGYGIFCNLADGLVPIDSDPFGGLFLSLTWDSYTGAALVQSDFAPSGTVAFSGPPYASRVSVLNHIYPCDWRWDFSALSVAADNVRGVGEISAPNDAAFSTITIDPAFAAKQILLYPVFIIEHSIAPSVTPF
jgi:hypothetical protein